MASTNFECIICDKTCESSEEIVSTDCGHVFHNKCLKQKHEGLWFSSLKVPKCPQCLAVTKTTTKLLFKFQSGPSAKDIEISELKSHVNHMYISRTQLQQQFESSEKNLQLLQAQTQAKDHEIMQLKQRIDFLTRQVEQYKVQQKDLPKLQRLQSLELTFSNLQHEYNKKDKELNQANKKLEQLTTQNKNFSRDLTNKNAQIQKLTENQSKIESAQTTNGPALEAKIKVLEEKNKHLSNELSKEIRNSSDISIQKMKLESLLQQFLKEQNKKESKLKTENDKEEAAAKMKEEGLVKSKTPEKTNLTDTQMQSQTKTASVSDTGIAKSADIENNILPIHKIVIKNIKESFANNAEMRTFALKLFSLMELSLIDRDLARVAYLGANKKDKTALVLSFKSSKSKDLVFAQKHKLKSHTETQHLTVEGHIDLNSQLYKQALVLKSFGFKKVFHHKNQILVKKTNASETIVIRSLADIDKLKAGSQCNVNQERICINL